MAVFFKDFFCQQEAQKAIGHMQRGEGEVPADAAHTEPFHEQIQEKIGHLVHGWKAEAVPNTAESSAVQSVHEPREIGDKACLPSAGVQQVN